MPVASDRHTHLSTQQNQDRVSAAEDRVGPGTTRGAIEGYRGFLRIHGDGSRPGTTHSSTERYSGISPIQRVVYPEITTMATGTSSGSQRSRTSTETSSLECPTRIGIDAPSTTVEPSESIRGKANPIVAAASR